MHEYSLIESAVEAILKDPETAGSLSRGKISEVVIKIGALDVHSEEALRQAYQMLVKGTAFERSSLKLIIFSPTLECAQCGYNGTYKEEEGAIPLPYAECPTCGSVAQIQGGRGIESVELIRSEPPDTR